MHMTIFNVTDAIVESISTAILSELQPMIEEINTNLNNLKENMSSLIESVELLNDSYELHNTAMNSDLASIALQLTALNDTMMEALVSVSKKCDVKENFLSNFSENSGSSCSEGSAGEELLLELGENIYTNFTLALKNSYGYITNPSNYTCNGEEGWRRVYHLNMTDSDMPCPQSWNLTEHPKRTCGRSSEGLLTCDSVHIPVSGVPYTKVCGMIKAYQFGATDAFETFDDGTVTSIDGPYVSGVSVTHGLPRNHIWTFASGVRETYHERNDACPCDATISISVPPFVGEDYFCESGLNTQSDLGFSVNDPLWDGEGCSESSTCCSFNDPPYFHKKLSTPILDDIEVRICQRDQTDDSPVEYVELYVK